MVAQRSARIRPKASARTARDLFRDQSHRAIETNREDVLAGIEIGVGLSVLNIGSIASDPGHNRLRILRMFADLPRQGEQFERELEINRIHFSALGQRRPLRLFAIDGFAELNIRTEPTRTQRDVKTRDRILAQLLGGGLRAIDAVGRERARELARRVGIVIRASDERAKSADLDGEAAGPAIRT